MKQETLEEELKSKNRQKGAAGFVANKIMENMINKMKQETLEEHNHLQGFINQFEEGGKHQELSNEDWTVSQFLKWLKLNNFKIVKNGYSAE
jgi:hypothetical protein